MLKRSFLFLTALFLLVFVYLFIYCSSENKFDLSKSIINGDFLCLIKNINLSKNNVNKISDNPVLVTALHSRFKDKMVKYLVLSGANINATDKNGWSPLAEAVSNVDYDYTKYFLSIGANVNQKTADGKSILMHVGNNGSDESSQIAKLLIENGANPKEVSRDGSTALSVAESLNNIKLVDYLKSFY